MGEKPGQLQARIAQATGSELTTVASTMRFAREAGLITMTGGRGRSAPDMLPMDAARTLLAIMAVEQPGTKAGSIVKTVGGMQCLDVDYIDGPFNLEALRGLRRPFQLDQAVAALIDIFANDFASPVFRSQMTKSAGGVEFLPDVHLEVQGMDAAELHMGIGGQGAAYFFAGPLMTLKEVRAMPDPRLVGHIRRSSSVNAPVIEKIAAGFRGRTA